MDILQWLQQWFSSQCDGGWEHSYVIIIDTLDNPGWCVRIDLRGTELEGKTFDRIENLDIDDDWKTVFYEVMVCGWESALSDWLVYGAW